MSERERRHGIVVQSREIDLDSLPSAGEVAANGIGGTEWRALAERLAGALREMLPHAASGVERLGNVVGPQMIAREKETLDRARSALADYEASRPVPPGEGER